MGVVGHVLGNSNQLVVAAGISPANCSFTAWMYSRSCSRFDSRETQPVSAAAAAATRIYDDVFILWLKDYDILNCCHPS